MLDTVIIQMILTEELNRRASIEAADIKAAKQDNDTPLHFAAQSGNSEVVQKLLDKSASVEKVNQNNDTPLHFAAQNGNLEIVKLLVNKGVNVKDKT